MARLQQSKMTMHLLLSALLIGCALLFGCSGDNGSNGASTGTVSGAVSDWYGNTVPGAQVATTVGGEEVSATTDANGKYTLTLPTGTFTLNVTASGYNALSQSVEAAVGRNVTADLKLTPTGPAAVSAIRTDTKSTVLPGDVVTLQASTKIFDPALQGQSVSYVWSTAPGSAPLTFSDTTSPTPTVSLPSSAALKKYLVETLALPYFKDNPDEPAVVIDRYQVVPFSQQAAATLGNSATAQVTATINGQIFTSTVKVPVKAPFVPNQGLNNVAVGQPVVLQGQFPFTPTPKTSWNWSVTGPSGAVTVNDANTAYPDFIPATVGTYTVSEGGVARLTITADKWVGMMAGLNTPDPTCNGASCHQDKITSWLQTGHKEVMYTGMMENPGDYSITTCAKCHTVGYNQYNSGINNGGFSDVYPTEGFTFTQGDPNVEANLWKNYPKSSRLIGVQCEACHGPQGSAHHVSGTVDPNVGNARVSFSANVCGTCHGSPKKHGRFQQWEQSAHGSFNTFTFNSNADGTLSGGCACCHSAQGFSAFMKLSDISNRNATVLPAGLTVNNAQPITCVVCHDPHNEGPPAHAGESFVTVNLTAVSSTAGSTRLLPGGFTANGVGKGALCITCHNSRNGYKSGSGSDLHEDGSVLFANIGTSYTAPHEACQGDVLMGRNAYFLGAQNYGNTATRSKHSFIADTCVTCHMELTPANSAFSLPQSESFNTNHDFKASNDICRSCHGNYSAEAVQLNFDTKLQSLKNAAGMAILRLRYGGAGTVPAGMQASLVANRVGQVDVTAGGVTQRWFLKTGSYDAYLKDASGNAIAGCASTPNADGSYSCTGYLDGAPGTVGNAVSTTGYNENLAKVLWNTVLVQDDASHGVHNPSFTNQVIDATYVVTSTGI